MALAQPTGLQVQTLQEPLITFEQQVEEVIPARTLITFNQVVDDSATLVPARELIGFTQVVDDSAEIIPARELITFQQVVDDDAELIPARTLITFEQRVRELTVIPARTLITFRQQVEEVIPARTLIRFRQAVRGPGATQPLRIYLDGQDITGRCLHSRVTINAGEGDNRTAELSYLPPQGVIDVPSFQGRVIEITREQGGQVVALFSGVVDEPVYQLDQPRNIRLRCSDLRSERLGREPQSRLQTLTGGLYSPIVQREDATGEEWVRELMRGVSGSLDYTGSGALRYSPWGTGTPAHSLQAGQIHYLSNSLQFSKRDQIVNRITARLEYRYYQRNTFTHTVDLEMDRAESGVGGTIGVLPAPGHTIPTKDALLSAIESVSGWRPMEVAFKPIAADGWYKYSAADTNKTAWTVNPVVRELRAMGVDASLERYISQPKRETYELTIEAPQSIAQYGEIDGRELRVSAETRVDPAVFEERGCVITADPDDRRADVNLALQVLQRIAAKEIRGAHRQNQVNLRYKPKTGRPGHQEWLPLEIGQTVSVTTPEMDVTGQVTAFQHVESSGDRWTDFSLAISQVNSAISVTEDWSLPAPPATYKLSELAQPTMTPDCPLPVDEQQVQGVSRIEPDGTVYVVAPAIGRGQVDEIIGTRTHTYNVDIPKDLFQVEVP
ncbi:hypothetical protein SAMN04487957_110150 [Halomonas shengliensis]|uniref:Uncharacterized protein n=1 Tax=Halomonas shengliensis TaxID=419597 RepID=A0A1H0LXX4_9GAMM|nr:hypothetical protein [Halomonas shengliensis]SDO73048.1 hypothetical protein SAMN04487957_110150 [Halomonas shengliensis]